jgi:formate-dependent nitrite reductase membrane component NrfD
MSKLRGGPGAVVPTVEVRTYYDKPVLKAPVWKWQIPGYFFTGGLAGASAVLSFAAGRTGNGALATAARRVGLAGFAASPPLLIADLGRPERFANMLRVFRPTSPMNRGSWLLGAFATAFVGGAAIAELPALEALAPLQPLAEGAAAALGLGLSTYTAVLLADTAVPAWHEAGNELPFVFAGGAAASAGAAAAVFTPTAAAGAARRMTVLGVVMEQVAVEAMERRLGDLAEPYHEGRAGLLSRVSRWASIAGAALLAAFGRRRAAAVAGGALVLVGSACERFAVAEAGKGSAKDPKYTVRPQRERLEAGAGHRDLPSP